MLGVERGGQCRSDPPDLIARRIKNLFPKFEQTTEHAARDRSGDVLGATAVPEHHAKPTDVGRIVDRSDSYRCVTENEGLTAAEIHVHRTIVVGDHPDRDLGCELIKEAIALVQQPVGCTAGSGARDADVTVERREADGQSIDGRSLGHNSDMSGAIEFA